MRYTVESTQDEFGTPRFFVLDEETADWVSDPFDTYEQAAQEAQERNTCPWCDKPYGDESIHCESLYAHR